MTTQWKGTGASPGLAAAPAYFIHQDHYTPKKLEAVNRTGEIQRFRSAVAQAQEEIEAIRVSTEQKLGADKAEIFEGHLMILEDPDFIDAAEEK